MPVYQYNGLHYDLPDGLSDEQAVGKIKAHLGEVEAPKEPSFGDKVSTGIAQSFAGVGNTVDTAGSMVAGGIAGLFGADKAQDAIYSSMNEREQSRNQWANPENIDVGVAGKVAGAALTLPMQVATFPLSPFTTGKTATDAGESGLSVQGAMATDVAGNMVGALIGPGKTLYSTIAKQAGANAAQEAVTKWVTQQMMSTEAGKKAFDPNLADTIVAGIVGGGMGAATHKNVPKPKPPGKAASLVEELNAPEAPKAPEAPITDTRTGLDKSKLAYEQALREKELQRQSAFNRPEQLGNMEAESPMARMARDLGAEPGKLEQPTATDTFNPLAEHTPMERMAFELENPNKGVVEGATAETATRQAEAAAAERQRVAQEALDARRVAEEQPVKQQTALEQQAAERARQEKAPVYSPEHMAEVARIQKMTDDVFNKHVSAMEKEKANADAAVERAKSTAAKDRAVAAQRAIELRQQAIHDEVARRGSLDRGAQERANQDKGTIPVDQEKHPFVQKAEDRLSKAEQILFKMMHAQEEGFAKITASQLARAKKDVAHLQAQVDKVRQNVSKERSPAMQALQRKQGGKVLVDWGSKKKLDSFSNIPGIKGKLRDIGHSMIKSPAEAIELAKKFPDVAQNTVQQTINSLTKGGTYLKGKVDNPVVHYVVDRFLDAENKARSEINTKLNEEYLQSLRNLTKEEYQDAFTMLNAADLNKKTITPEQMAKHGLSDNLQQFILTHQHMMDDVLGKINAARAAVDKPPVTAREAYSAMSMSGDYRKVAYKTIDGVKTVVGVIGANRKSGKFGWTLDKAEKAMLEKDPTLEFGPLRDTSTAKGLKGTPHEAFQDALKVIGENNPHVAEFLNTLKEVAKDDPANYMGMQTHTMQKKGVWGMEGRKPWMTETENANAFFENQVNYMESAYKWGHLAEAARDANSVLRDPAVVGKQGNAVKMSEKYMQSALGLNPSRVGRAVDEIFNAIGDATGVGPSNMKSGLMAGRSLANTMMLSLNPSFLAIQVIQGPAAIPAMTALLRGRGLAPKSSILTGGLDYVTAAGLTLLKSTRNMEGLSTIDKGALKYARDHHIYASDMVEHTNQTQKNATYWMHKATQSPAAMIESGTRAQTYMAFVKMMNDSGLKVSDGLYEQAHRMTDMAMNNYGALEKPAFYNALGPIGSMAYNLKSFGHNEISRWSMFAREIGATGNPVPLLTQMASTIALAGVMGLPFFSQWESLYDYITKKLGTPRSLTLDVMEASGKVAKELGSDADKFKYVMSHGASTMLGADISKRVGLGDVLASNASDTAFPGGGKLVSMATTAAGAIAHPDEEHAKAAAMAWLPSLVAAPLKEEWYTKGDLAYTMNPDKPNVATAQLNERDKLLKKVGITGINESVQKEQYFQQNNLEKAYSDIKDKGLLLMSQDVFAGRPISQKAIDLFIKGQGDPSTLEASLVKFGMQQGIPQNQLKILKDAASTSITKMYDLQRRTQ